MIHRFSLDSEWYIRFQNHLSGLFWFRNVMLMTCTGELLHHLINEPKHAEKRVKECDVPRRTASVDYIDMLTSSTEPPSSDCICFLLICLSKLALVVVAY